MNLKIIYMFFGNKGAVMDNVLLFSFPSDNVFYGQVGLDLKTLKITELNQAKPLVLVCRSRAYCAYLFEKFFKGRPVRVYVNFDESGQVAKVSVFLHVLVEPPRQLGERDRYFLHGIADLLSLPQNGQVKQAVYGTVFPVSAKKVLELKSNFQAAGFFLAGLGAQERPNFMVLMPDQAQLAKTDMYTEQPTDDFLNFMFSLPQKAWK